MDLDKLKGCHGRITRYCNFGLVEMHEYDLWLEHISFYLNDTSALLSTNTTTVTSSTLASLSASSSSSASAGYDDYGEMGESDWSVLCDQFDARYARFWDQLMAANWAHIFICILGILVNCICKNSGLLFLATLL